MLNLSRSLQKLSSAGIILTVILWEQSMSLLLGSKPNFLLLLIIYAFDVGFFLFSAFIIRKFAFGKSFWRLRLLLILLVLPAVFLPMHFTIDALTNLLAIGKFRFELTKLSTVIAITRGLYIIGFSLVAAFYKRGIEMAKEEQITELRLLRAEQKQVEMEMADQLARSKPHLVRNTLNFIYAIVEPISYDASRAIHLLTEMQDYATKEVLDGKVLLKDELAQIDIYIGLHQLMKENMLFMDYKANLDQFEQEPAIPPMLLINFVENIFKHGDLSNPGKPAIVIIHCDGKDLFFKSTNLIGSQKNKYSSGLGLMQARKRLDHFYNGKYELTTRQEAGEFELYFKISL